MTDQEWRDVRYLYDYSEDELADLARKVEILNQKAKKVYVIFNNNLAVMQLIMLKSIKIFLDIDYEGLAPQQLKLF